MASGVVQARRMKNLFERTPTGDEIDKSICSITRKMTPHTNRHGYECQYRVARISVLDSNVDTPYIDRCITYQPSFPRFDLYCIVLVVRGDSLLLNAKNHISTVKHLTGLLLLFIIPHSLSVLINDYHNRKDVG